MTKKEKCPVCGGEIISEEDWTFGRTLICEQNHFRKVERYDKPPAPDLLDKQEKGETNAS